MRSSSTSGAGGSKAHHEACGGYAADLPSLSRPRQFLAADLTSARSVSTHGYKLMLARHPSAAEVSDAPVGCEGTVTAYVATAVPVTPGTTGERHFAAGADGTIYWDMDERFADPKPLQ